MLATSDRLVIQTLHKQHAASEKAFQIVFSHCEIIAEICSSLAKNNPQVNDDLVVTGALLHDIGAYAFLNADGIFFDEKNYVQHGIKGYVMLKDAGLPEAICRFAKYHTGVGIARQEIEDNHIPLPLEDYFPATTEEALVMYADKFHSKTPRFHRFETYRNSLRKYSHSEDKQKKIDSLAKQFGMPDIVGLANKYHQPFD